MLTAAFDPKRTSQSLIAAALSAFAAG